MQLQRFGSAPILGSKEGAGSSPGSDQRLNMSVLTVALSREGSIMPATDGDVLLQDLGAVALPGPAVSVQDEPAYRRRHPHVSELPKHFCYEVAAEAWGLLTRPTLWTRCTDPTRST